MRLAKQHGVKVGAHPSLPDLQGFGRREMKMPREELANCMIYQIGALKGFLDAEGMPLNHIKPHGSLYGMAARMEEVAHAVCDAADVFGVPLMGMVDTCHEKRLHRARARLHRRILCRPRLHRRRQPDHHPRARGDGPGRRGRPLAARHHGRQDDVASAARTCAVGADAICVHSDTPNAVAVARAVRDAVTPYLEAA